jgi:hypothetical protein
LAEGENQHVPGPEDIEQWLGPQEDLHEDLQPHLIETEGLGWMIHHPLVVQPLHHPRMNGLANRALAYKKQALIEAFAEKRWETIMWLHERPYRFEAFQQVELLIEDDCRWWALLGTVWVDSENIWQHRDDWQEYLSQPRPHRHCFMDEEDREEHEKLPDSIRVYRGSTPGVNDDGLSWTTDREKAEWFAKRLRRKGEERAVLAGWVEKVDVVAFVAGRGEAEIVVTDPEHVQVEDYWLVPDDR